MSEVLSYLLMIAAVLGMTLVCIMLLVAIYILLVGSISGLREHYKKKGGHI